MTSEIQAAHADEFFGAVRNFFRRCGGQLFLSLAHQAPPLIV